MIEGASDGGVPHQVPPAPLRFVNREAELAAITDLFREGVGRRTRIAVCTGLPGVGKTSLVRHFVEQNRGVFPGGELFVDFGGLDEVGDGASVSDALASCLLALGVAEKVIPSRLADRAGLFRTKTSARAMLVVLDDVAEPAQVPVFVPNAPGSAVLVTSNSRLSELRLDGADVLPLEPLEEPAAVHLLRELCGARDTDQPDDFVRLVRECGGLPVALRVAAARLIGRGSLTVRALAEEIADEHRGLAAFAVRGQDRVTAVFSVAYTKLPVPAARLYRLLGASPAADFTVDVAAAAVGIDTAACTDLLDVVVEAGLLQDDRGGRFRFHALLRRHALERAMAEEAESERLAAAGRLVSFLLAHAAWADLTVTGPGRYRCTPHDQILGNSHNPFSTDKARALDWLDDERVNLVAAVRASVEYGWHDFAWQLAESATALYANRRYLVDWTETSELGAAAAGLAGHVAAEARLRSFSSRAWLDLGMSSRARSELDTAFSLASQIRDIRLLASIWEMDGRYHEAVGDPARASDSFRRAIELFASVDDRRGVAFVTYFLGCAQQAQGERELSQATLVRALTLIREVDDSKMEGRALITIGRGLTELGRDQEARSAFERAIDVLVAGADLFHESWAQEALAELAERTHDRSLARDCVLRMVEIHTRLGSGRIDELRQRSADLE